METEENFANNEDNQSEDIRMNGDSSNNFNDTLVEPSVQSSDYKLEPVVVAAEEPVVQAPIAVNVDQNPPISPETEKRTPSTPGQFVMQWLTYAFWGWSVSVMSFVVVTMFTYFLKGPDLGYASLYGAAAILVLLPISIICDVFYSKHEPAKKTGGSSVVMVIHAVLFALAGIGSLITAVWQLVTLYISLNDTTGAQITLYSSLIIATLFTIVFLRTIIPGRLFYMRRYFLITMSVIVGVICLATFFGPVTGARLTRVDKLIESNLDSVKSAIDNYTDKNKSLPNDLSDITLTGDAKKLVSDNLVKYDNGVKNSTRDIDGDQTFYYELCVTYEAASQNDYGYSSYEPESDGYSSSLYVYSHPKGLECYKLKNVVYGNSYDDYNTYRN